MLKSRDITLPTKVHLSQSYGFFSSHVWMWELDYRESWSTKEFMVLEKTLERPLDCKEIQPVNPKGNQSWIFIGQTDAEAEAPILWPPDANNWVTGRDPDSGKDWRQEEKGTTEDEMVKWHHPLDGHEFEQAPGVGDGQGNLVCCSPWDCKELDTTEWLTWMKPVSFNPWNREHRKALCPGAPQCPAPLKVTASHVGQIAQLMILLLFFAGCKNLGSLNFCFRALSPTLKGLVSKVQSFLSHFSSCIPYMVYCQTVTAVA